MYCVKEKQKQGDHVGPVLTSRLRLPIGLQLLRLIYPSLLYTSILSHSPPMTTALDPILPYEWEMNFSSSPSFSINVSEASTSDNVRSKEGLVEVEEEKARCEWDFHLSTVVSSSSTSPLAASDALGAVEIDPSYSFLATGGIARKIRIYRLSSLVANEDEHTNGSTRVSDNSRVCEFYMCTPAKLSSLRWRPDCGGGRVVGAGDYDGVVTEYDVERRVPVSERDEHGGHRVWSVSYSSSSCTAAALGASGSDDGTAHVWDARAGPGAVEVVVPGGGRAVCSVEFDPAGTPAIGVGCADRKAYIYDVRSMAAPVAVFEGHTRAVTYVRFADGGRVVTSAADGSHRLWMLGSGKEMRVYRGHVNSRSFIGLSVWRGSGLIGCGSESNKVFVYDLRWGEPIWVKGFEEEDEEINEEDSFHGAKGGRGSGGSTRGFVSSVCWGEDEDEGLLVAGGSNGVLQVFVARRKPVR